MYNNTGTKIVSLASALCAILIFLAIIEGIVIFASFSRNDSVFLGLLLGVVVAGAGSFLAYIGFLLLAGFGELVENTAEINAKLSSSNSGSSSGPMYPKAAVSTSVSSSEKSVYTQSAPTHQESSTITCPFCKRVWPRGTVFCSGCGGQIGAKK